jgi:hypothetical protein
MWLVGQAVVLLASLVSPTLPLPIRYNDSSKTSTKASKIYSNRSQEAVDLRNSVLEMYDILSVVQFKIVKLLYKLWQHLLSLVIIFVTLYRAPLGYYEGVLRKTRYYMNSSVKIGRRLKNN